MWDDFKVTTKTAKSIARIATVYADINNDTFEEITTVFADVLNRPSQKYQIDYDKDDKKPLFKQSYQDLSKDMFINIKEDIEYSFDNAESSIFKKNDQRYETLATKFPKLDVVHYRNQSGKITISSPQNQFKEEFDQFLHKIANYRRSQYRQQLDSLFNPNKATQTTLSSVGTEFDIPALVMNLINPVPEPLIYLKQKGGLIRNYGVSVIIDSSKSCFNLLSSSHSYQSIKTLFAALASIEIPCADVVIATDSTPIVLCSEIQSSRLFSNKSPFFASLFNCLSEQNNDKCDLESAIHAAYDIRRMRSSVADSFMFILTDGLYQKDQKELIKSYIMACIQGGINIYGIGIYPVGIVDLFPNAVFAPNPNNLINGIASCSGDDSSSSYDDSIPLIIPIQNSFDEILNLFQTFKENEDKPIFKDLKKYLHDTKMVMDSFSFIYNEEQEVRNSMGVLVNPEGANTEMYQRDYLAGQKILIVMLYDRRANTKENAKITKKYLLEPANAGNKAYVKKAAEFFGVDLVVVTNYKDAVTELTKQTIKGKCDYYATWVLSGYPYDVRLPDGGNQYLVMQFIDCLLQFWNNGGSVVLFAEGELLIFQANLFWEKVIFPDNKKTQLRFGGNHKGMTYLKGDISGKLNTPGLFNKSDVSFEKYQRSSLAHNLVEIYEGEKNSYGPNDKDKYSPFIPFMKDSENGTSSYFYPANEEYRLTGDIIVDGGYTKAFDKMSEKGTFKYFQNIIAWTAQVELKLCIGIDPKLYRPDAVIFTLDESQKCTLQKPPPVPGVDISKLKRLFAIDFSGSVGGSTLFHSEVKSIFDKFYQSGDSIMIWGSKAQIIDYKRMKEIYTNKEGNEGTYPYVIAEKLANDSSIPRQHLILVTDGEVNKSDIEKCDQVLRSKNIQFNYVTSYLIGDETKKKASISNFQKFLSLQHVKLIIFSLLGR